MYVQIEWKPVRGDVPGVTFRTNINIPNINLVILIITINMSVCVEGCVILCSLGLCLCSLVLSKEFICSCHLWGSVAIYRNIVFAQDGIG